MKIKSKKWYGWFWPPERRKIRLMQAIVDHMQPKIDKKFKEKYRDILLYGTEPVFKGARMNPGTKACNIENYFKEKNSTDKEVED